MKLDVAMYQFLKDFAAPIATIIASIVVVGVTAHFSRVQARLASEKIRHDLFDRRLKIFESIFPFYEAMISWEGAPEQIEARKHFFAAYHESGFLFGANSEIELTMKNLNDRGRRAIGLKEMLKDKEAGFDPQTRIQMLSEMTKIHTTEFDIGLAKLKSAIAPYLNFHDFKSK